MNVRPHSGERVKDIAAGLLVSVSRPNSRVKKDNKSNESAGLKAPHQD
jgi:hypothetical protein